MDKHWHTTTLLFDTWNKKRRHKSVHKYDNIEKTEKNERFEQNNRSAWTVQIEQNVFQHIITQIMKSVTILYPNGYL